MAQTVKVLAFGMRNTATNHLEDPPDAQLLATLRVDHCRACLASDLRMMKRLYAVNGDSLLFINENNEQNRPTAR